MQPSADHDRRTTHSTNAVSEQFALMNASLNHLHDFLKPLGCDWAGVGNRQMDIGDVVCSAHRLLAEREHSSDAARICRYKLLGVLEAAQINPVPNLCHQCEPHRS